MGKAISAVALAASLLVGTVLPAAAQGRRGCMGARRADAGKVAPRCRRILVPVAPAGGGLALVYIGNIPVLISRPLVVFPVIGPAVAYVGGFVDGVPVGLIGSPMVAVLVVCGDPDAPGG